MSRLGLLLLLVSVGARAQDGGAGVLTRAPTLVKQVEAVFPPDMMDAGTGGTVVMDVDIGADGTVTRVAVVQSAGPSFDAAAIQALEQFQFTPAEVDGRPAPVRIQYSYQFFFRPEVVEVPAADAGSLPPSVNFAGRVVERGTRDAVGGAQVVVTAPGEVVLDTVTDDEGRFELAGVPEGTATVTVVAGGYLTYSVSEDFAPGKRTEATYFVRKKASGGMETVVRTARERKEVAQVTISQQEIRLVPGTAGDTFRVVQNLPGVARAPFGLGLLIVRGGRGWDTKTYVDETPVPLLFHFGGLFSTYNANLLENLSFQAGNFNADFGRATGGLITATGRTPSKKGVHGYADVNVVDASALVETPLGKDWSVAVSARRSYIDALLPAVLNLIPGANEAVRFTLAPRYWDYQARVEYRPERGALRFFASFFGSSDALVATLPNPSIDPEGRGEFGTAIAYNKLVLGVDYKISDALSFRSRTSAGIENYDFTLGRDIFARSTQYPLSTRNTFTWSIPAIRTELAMGVDAQLVPYTVDLQTTQVPRLNQVPDPFASRTLVSVRTTILQAEPAAFLTATVKPVDALTVVGSVRADYNSQIDEAWVDPRLSVLWQLHPRVLVKGGAGLYHQIPDYRGGQLLEGYGNPGLSAEGARQYMVGSEVRFTDFLNLDLQLYYKDLFNQSRATVAQTGGDGSATPVEPPYASIGRGRSYGMEILLRHQLHANFFGWIAYSLSRTERDFFGGTAWGPSAFDQPHNLVVVASYQLPLDFIVGAKVRYASGPLNRPVRATLYDANANYYFPIQSQTYDRRLPDFFQLDVRIDKRFVFRDWMLALYLDVQNVTYQRNVEALTYSYDYSQEAYLTGLPILPVLGVRAEW